MPSPTTHPRPAPTAAWSLVVATGILVASVATIWATKFQVAESLYVSGLGATGMPTAAAFNTALLGIGVAGVLGVPAMRGIRSRLGWLRWSPAATLLVTALAFAGASRVTCTAGCPIPFTAGSSTQDLVHVALAAAGFAGAAVVMVQVATSELSRRTRALAWIAAGATGAVSAAGAGLSLLRFRTDVGATLEFVAMTVGVGWLAVFLLVRATRSITTADDGPVATAGTTAAARATVARVRAAAW